MAVFEQLRHCRTARNRKQLQAVHARIRQTGNGFGYRALQNAFVQNLAGDPVTQLDLYRTEQVGFDAGGVSVRLPVDGQAGIRGG